MPAKTTHIIPIGDGWVVKKERDHVSARKQGSGLAMKDRAGRGRATSVRSKRVAAGVYSTQRQAIEAARRIVQRSAASQIVVHTRNGSIRWLDVRGLPVVQTSPVKSSLGTNAIKRAVSAVIRERLERD
jgi:hypothetical protein